MRSCVVITLLLAGCSRDLSKGTALLTGPEAFEWKGTNYRIKGEPSMNGGINTSGDVLRFYAVGYPPGTKLSLLGQSVVVKENGAATLETSFWRTVGDWPVDAFLPLNKGKKVPGLMVRETLTVELVGGRSFQLELEVPPSAIDDALTRVAKGPLLFDGEEPVAGKPKNVLFGDGVFGGLFGEADAIKDVDAIALARRLKGWTKDCSGYTYANGKAAPNVKVSIQPTELTIYERRTGKALAQQTFDADPTCPRTALGNRGNSYFPKEEVDAYLDAWVVAQRDARSADSATAGD